MDARAELISFFQSLHTEISQECGSHSNGAFAVKQALHDIGYGFKRYPEWVLRLVEEQLPDYSRKVVYLKKVIKKVNMDEADFKQFFRHRLQGILTDHPRAMSEFHKKQSRSDSHGGILAAIDDNRWKVVLDILTRKFESLVEFPELVDFAETQIASQGG